MILPAAFVAYLLGAWAALILISLALCGAWKGLRWWWNNIVFPPTGYVPEKYRVVDREES